MNPEERLQSFKKIYESVLSDIEEIKRRKQADPNYSDELSYRADFIQDIAAKLHCLDSRLGFVKQEKVSEVLIYNYYKVV